MIIQQTEPEFLGELVDSEAGAEKAQDDLRATCGIRKVRNYGKKRMEHFLKAEAQVLIYKTSKLPKL